MNQTIIAIIDEYTDTSNFTKLEMKTLSMSKGIFDDVTIDEFIVNELKPQKPSILIIPASLGSIQTNYWGLRVGMHIRLSSAMEEYRFIPIIFVSQSSLEEILRFQEEKLGVQCTLDSSLLVGNNIEELQAAIDYLEPISKDKYISGFLEKIIIERPPSIGKHSLANIWGAIRLNEVLNLNAIDKSLTKRTKELYFKYLRAFYEESKDSFKDLQPLRCTGKRILLIDDESDKGWNDVLKAIFKGSDFQSIDFKNKTYEVAEQEAISKSIVEDWDLILLDLRLNPSEEDTGDKIIKTEDYSGARILKAIKKYNSGIQVIMLTASNKAWNMKKLLDLGADGYYIKESPEFNFSPESTHASYDNFVNECNACFDKYYLRKIFEIDKVIQRRLDLENGNLGNHTLSRGTINLIKAYLRQAFNTIYEYSQTQKEYALYSFLEYYKIVELLGKELINDNPTKFFIKKKSGNIDFIIKSPLLSKIEPLKKSSSTSKYFIKGYKEKDYTPISDEEIFYKKPTSSLRFSGLMLLRFGFSEASVETFISLNNLRNTVVAHSADNSTSEIKVENVITLLEILGETFQKL